MRQRDKIKRQCMRGSKIRDKSRREQSERGSRKRQRDKIKRQCMTVSRMRGKSRREQSERGSRKRDNRMRQRDKIRDSA